MRQRSLPSPTSGSTPTSDWFPGMRLQCTSPGPGGTDLLWSECPCTSQEEEAATRIEYRSPDPGANPYLAFSVMLAAGLAGINNKYDLSAPIEKNIFHMSDAERKAAGIGSLPGSLNEAIGFMENSKLVREALGDHVFNAFIANKKKEWDTYRIQVTEWEQKRYLPLL